MYQMIFFQIIDAILFPGLGSLFLATNGGLLIHDKNNKTKYFFSLSFLNNKNPKSYSMRIMGVNSFAFWISNFIFDLILNLPFSLQFLISGSE